jgi:hypothetical protein
LDEWEFEFGDPRADVLSELLQLESEALAEEASGLSEDGAWRVGGADVAAGSGSDF